jgi:Flp pilus assembly protein TadG
VSHLGPRRRRGQRGAVTAELALGLPLLLAVTLGLVWLLVVGVAQVRVVDAAREAARAAARGEPTGAAVSLALRVAPSGAQVAVTSAGDDVRVVVSAEVDGPGGLFAFLPGVQVVGEAVAAREPEP